MRLLKEIRSLIGNYHTKSGMYHYFRNEFTQAEEFLRKALREGDLSAADRRSTRYYLTLALMDSATRLQEREDLEGGVEKLHQAAEVSPDYPDIFYRLGLLLEELGQREQAVDEYRKAIELKDDYLTAQTALGFCLLRLDRVAEAETAFRAALARKIDRVERPFRQATELVAQGEKVEAAELFYDALVASPELCEEFVVEAMTHLRAEEYEKALAQFDRALTLKPKYPDLHNFRGVVLCELDRLDEAVEAFRLSSALAPQYLVPRLNLAFALLRAEEYKEAEAELESILAQDPTEPTAAAKLEELRMGRPPDKRRPVSRGSNR